MPTPRDRNRQALLVLLAALLILCGVQAVIAAQAATPAIAAPVLKWQHGGCFSSWCETGWYASPAVADLDGDGVPEVIASAYSIVALDGATGNLRWRAQSGHDRSENPDMVKNVGRTWPGIIIADVDGNGSLEIVSAHGGGVVAVYIVIPSDVHYIAAYEGNGVQIPANSIYGNKAWGKVGVHVDHTVDLRGYANCGTEHRPNFAHSPATIADVDGDGLLEIIVVGNVYNCGTNPYTDLYEMPFIFSVIRQSR